MCCNDGNRKQPKAPKTYMLLIYSVSSVSHLSNESSLNISFRGNLNRKLSWDRKWLQIFALTKARYHKKIPEKCNNWLDLSNQRTVVFQTETLRRHAGELNCSSESVSVVFAHMNAL